MAWGGGGGPAHGIVIKNTCMYFAKTILEYVATSISGTP